MITVRIGLTTAPRKSPTIDKSILSLRKAGFDQKIDVFAEPNSLTPRDKNVQIHQHTSTKGCFFNFKEALHYMLHETDADLIFMVQDDVIYKKGSAEDIISKASKIQELGFFSPYLANHDAGVVPQKTPGIHRHHLHCAWGALTYIFTRESAWKLMNHPFYTEHKSPKALDCVVCKSMKQMGMGMYVNYPSLASHIGFTSTVGHQPMNDHKGFGFSR